MFNVLGKKGRDWGGWSRGREGKSGKAGGRGVSFIQLVWLGLAYCKEVKKIFVLSVYSGSW